MATCAGGHARTELPDVLYRSHSSPALIMLRAPTPPVGPEGPGALRRVLTVVSDGYVMDGDELREAAGFSGRPSFR